MDLSQDFEVFRLLLKFCKIKLLQKREAKNHAVKVYRLTGLRN